MLVDTNILVYAINADSPKNKQAQAFLLRNTSKLLIAHQNIFETLRVLTHPKFSYPMDPKTAQESVDAIVDACTIIYPNYKTYRLAFELIKKHDLVGNRIFDAYLAATALSNGIESIATDNVKDFIKFTFEVINPFQVK